MKSDTEIKEWIDSREALTQVELSMFIYGYWRAGNRTSKWWGYALSTKDWATLREYKQLKLNSGGGKCRKDKKEIQELILKDERLQRGSRYGTRILKQVYGIDLQRSIFLKYKREILC